MQIHRSRRGFLSPTVEAKHPVLESFNLKKKEGKNFPYSKAGKLISNSLRRCTHKKLIYALCKEVRNCIFAKCFFSFQFLFRPKCSPFCVPLVSFTLLFGREIIDPFTSMSCKKNEIKRVEQQQQRNMEKAEETSERNECRKN